MDGVATGLSGMAFWLFIAAVVVAGVWSDSRKRESQQETLRRLVESGQNIDKKTVDRILNSGGNKDLARDLKIGGLIVIFIAPGLAIMGWFMSKVSEEIFPVLLGVSLLVGFVGIGLFAAANFVKRGNSENQGQ